MRDPYLPPGRASPARAATLAAAAASITSFLRRPPRESSRTRAAAVDQSRADGRPIAELAQSIPADGELASDAAHAAKDAWGEASATERAEVLNAVADAIVANKEMLAAADSWDNGKPVRETLAADVPLPALSPARPVIRTRSDALEATSSSSCSRGSPLPMWRVAERIRTTVAALRGGHLGWRPTGSVTSPPRQRRTCMRTDLVVDALQMATRNSSLAGGVICHSDRGAQ